MKSLLWIGLSLLVAGLVLLFVPIPHSEKHGVKAGDLSLGVETRSQEKVSPVLCGVMIAAGAGLMVVGRFKA
jgi:hypothetical protein